VQALQKWLKGEASSLHSQICENVAARFALSKHSLQSFLKQLFEARQWNFEGELSQDLLQLKAKNGISESAKYHVIYFDAYSSKSSPFLWQEDFLCSFLKLHANENSCCFASYASRSSLKRALKEQKFRLVKRKGFMQKRECTFALRSHLR
jgi:tRNA U34 5-methylaminomethyl-2-thiouridine-forming methyltransferase MnmC